MPAPLTPPHCDLRGFDFMPLDVVRLRRSKSWLRCKRRPEIGFYLLNLWSASWHNVPAASIEDDDDVLADMAMCDPSRWTEVKDEVLSGWIRCSDGLLYHPVVAEKAGIAWQAKQDQRQRTEAARVARLAKRRTMSSVATTSVTDCVTASVVHGDSLCHRHCAGVAGASTDTNREGEGEREVKEKEETPELRSVVTREPAKRGHRLPADWQPSPADRQEARDMGVDPERVAPSFRDYWHATAGKAGVKLDWPATWRNWCRREADRLRPAQGGRAAPPSKMGWMADRARHLAERGAALPEQPDSLFSTTLDHVA